MEGYTHLAKIYGFKCYFNDSTNDVKGTNWFNDFMIDIAIWFDFTFCDNDGFVIQIIKPLN